ncbi:MAG TPA: aldehyde dehydrogenase (NADP(+)) [Tepidisphaeraceae bacterium]|nr:aldehyde dehydrogenase (NADP(+)) [Tepidisphaeraceae bacterium]
MGLTHDIVGKHLINGTWVGEANGAFEAMSPATGATLLPKFAEAGAAEVDLALLAARSAFDASLDLPPRWPAPLLDGIAAKVMDLGDALLERGEAETALPRGRLTMERGRTVGQLKMFAEFVREGSWVDATIDTPDPTRAPVPKPDIRRVLRPRGPVAVFGASNFPFAFSAVGGDTASALAAGCPVIVKGHPSHPGTSELFAAAVLAALQECKLPLGLFALLQGRSNELGATLVRHPAVTAVGFTGSQKAGRALFDLAAARPSPIPAFAEMGSINPLVILPGAFEDRMARIAEGLSASVLLGGGQFCTKPGVVFAVGERSESLVSRVGRVIGSTQPITMLSPSLRDNFMRRVRDLAYTDNVGNTDAPDESVGAAGTWAAMFQTDAATFQREPTLREEVFGPSSLVVHCKDTAELLACLDVIQGSLTGTVHIGAGDEEATVRAVIRKLEEKVGRVIVNGYPTGVEVCDAMVHGGPYPATTDASTTSVGSSAIRRFARPVAFQDTPDALLPPALQNANPLGIERTVNGKRTNQPL